MPKEVVQSWVTVLEAEYKVAFVPVSTVSDQVDQIKALVSLVQSWQQKLSPDTRSLTFVGFENVSAVMYDRSPMLTRTRLQSGRTTLAKLCQSALESFTISDSPPLIAKEQSVDERASVQRALARNKGPLQRVKDPLPLGE